MQNPLLSLEAVPRRDEDARKLAKLIKRCYGVRYCQALEIVAIRYGWKDWREAALALASMDQSKKFLRRQASKERQKIRKKTKINIQLLRRLKKAREHSEQTECTASGWRGWRTPTWRVRYCCHPINRLAARVRFKPYLTE